MESIPWAHLKCVCFSSKLHNEDDPPEPSAAEQPSAPPETPQPPQPAASSEADVSPPPYCSIAVEAAAPSGIYSCTAACQGGVCMNQHLVRSGTMLLCCVVWCLLFFFPYALNCSKKLCFYAQPIVWFVQKKHTSKLCWLFQITRLNGYSLISVIGFI